jgi:hypothetical protein
MSTLLASAEIANGITSTFHPYLSSACENFSYVVTSLQPIILLHVERRATNPAYESRHSSTCTCGTCGT